MKKIILKLVLLILFSTFNSVSSQQIILVKDSTNDGTIKFALISGGIKPQTSKETKEFLKKILKSEVGVDFYLYKTITDDLGMTHEKYQQVVNGIKVEFCEFIIHKDKSGRIVSLNGDFARLPKTINSKPKFTFESVLEKHGLSRKTGKYNVRALELETSVESPISVRGTNYEVVFVKDAADIWHLAYKANLIGETILDNFYGYIDCETNEMIKVQPLVYHVNATGSASTIYSGSRTISTDLVSGTFRLQESTRGLTNTVIQTLNFNRNPAFFVSDVTNGVANATDFTDNDNNWTTAEFNNTNHDNAALDAHWGAEMTFDYFHTVHNRVSYDNNNGTIRSYVHVQTRALDANNDFVPINMDNAFWLPTQKAMFYGDGLFFDPTVSLDICAHELGHAVCNSSVGNGIGLTYEKESGALNESLSDIWGACVEQWSTTGKQTWICGEDVFWGGLRSMNNPDQFNQPSTYLGIHWANTVECTPTNINDRCGVHINSGVGNFWFFLLSQGGTGTNDIGNNYFVDGIGINNAARIVYRMETNYLLSSSGYSDARFYSINAAIDLFGVNSVEVAAVTNAWYAVGVGNRFQYAISGTSPICDQAVFTINSLVPGSTVIWSVTPANIVSLQQTGNTATLTKLDNNHVTLSATINQVLTLTKYLTVGYPVSLCVDNISNLTMEDFDYGSVKMLPKTGAYPYGGVLSIIDCFGFATSYSWSVAVNYPPGKPVFWSNNGGIIDISAKSSSTSITLTCTASNSCGSFSKNFRFHTDNFVPFLLNLTPNPASNGVEVSIAEDISAKSSGLSSTTESTTTALSYSITVVDCYGSTVYSGTKKQKKFNIPTSTFRNGIYSVVVSDGINVYQNKLVVKH
ncbi:MAG: M4 family metallopeptidase [Paludibacter sp.]